MTEIVILMQDYGDKSSVRILHLPNQAQALNRTDPNRTDPSELTLTAEVLLTCILLFFRHILNPYRRWKTDADGLILTGI